MSTQGSPEWHRERLGMITASRFKDVMSKTTVSAKQWQADVTGTDRQRAISRLMASHEDGTLAKDLAGLSVADLAGVSSDYGIVMQGKTKDEKARCLAAGWEPRPFDRIPNPLGDTAERYLYDLICEHELGTETFMFETSAMRHGSEHEDNARIEYEAATGAKVVQVGFVTHWALDYVGGSPDGLVGDDGLIEIKCPQTRSIHRKTCDVGMPPEHKPQVQGLLWITGRQWCDFVSFHPEYAGTEKCLRIDRQPRDEKYIANLSKCVSNFEVILKSKLQREGVPF